MILRCVRTGTILVQKANRAREEQIMHFFGRDFFQKLIFVFLPKLFQKTIGMFPHPPGPPKRLRSHSTPPLPSPGPLDPAHAPPPSHFPCTVTDGWSVWGETRIFENSRKIHAKSSKVLQSKNDHPPVTWNAMRSALATHDWIGRYGRNTQAPYRAPLALPL